jgi:putative aldouronate transport system substrate-binding protein
MNRLNTSKKVRIPFLRGLLSVILALTMTACGAETGQSSVTTGTRPAGGEVSLLDQYAPIEGKRYTISFVAYQLAPVNENARMLEYWNEVFNVDLDLWNIDANQWNEVLNLKFVSGDIPDMIRITDMMNLDNYVKQDLLAAIPEDVLDAFAPKTVAALEAEYPGILKYGKKDGLRYGIPSEVRLSNRYRAPLVYRGDWLSAIGLTKPPETLTEFTSVMTRFALDDPDKNGRKDTYGLSKDGMSAVFGAHGVIFNNNWDSELGFWLEDNGNLSCSGVMPGLKDALALLSQWYADGILDPEFITGENTGGYWALSHAFINGRIGFTTHGAYYHWIPAVGSLYIPPHNAGELYKKNPAAARSLKYGMPLAGPAGQSGIQQSNLFPGGYVGFGRQLDDEPDKMGKLLQMIDTLCATSFSNFANAWYGIEGEHFHYNLFGVPIPDDIYVDGKELSKIGAHVIMLPVMLMQFIEEGENRSKSPEALLYKKWIADNRFSEGGVTNKLVVTTPALNKYKAELVKMQAEMIVSIITGDLPVDSFDAYVAKWRKSGGALVEQEINDWYHTLDQ